MPLIHTQLPQSPSHHLSKSSLNLHKRSTASSSLIGVLLYLSHDENGINSINDIVKICIQSAMYNSNAYNGYKLAFQRYKYSLDMHDCYTASMKTIKGQNLSDYQSSIVNNLSTLIDMI